MAGSLAQWASDHLGCQVACAQCLRASRTFALRMTRSLRARVMRMTISGFPALLNPWWNALGPSWKRAAPLATRNRMERTAPTSTTGGCGIPCAGRCHWPSPRGPRAWRWPCHCRRRSPASRPSGVRRCDLRRPRNATATRAQSECGHHSPSPPLSRPSPALLSHLPAHGHLAIGAGAHAVEVRFSDAGGRNVGGAAIAPFAGIAAG